MISKYIIVANFNNERFVVGRNKKDTHVFRELSDFDPVFVGVSEDVTQFCFFPKYVVQAYVGALKSIPGVTNVIAREVKFYI